MSMLPVGFKNSTEFLESIIIKGVMAKTGGIALFAIPIIGPILSKGFETILKECLLDPGMDEVTKVALAGVYVIDRKAFDRTFVELKISERMNLSPAQMEEKLRDAEKAAAAFFRRGPVR
jgi:hypothetical protein